MQSRIFPAGWPVRRAVEITRERLLPEDGHGVVLVAENDPVEPDQAIAQGADGSPPVVAGLRGRVARVVPQRGAVVTGQVALAQGLAGFGPEACGPLVLWPLGSIIAPTVVTPGSIVAIPGALTPDIYEHVTLGNAAGIFAANASPDFITALTGTECTALLDGTLPPVTPPPIAVVLAHGFGPRLPGREIWQLLAECAGALALLTPATNVLRGQRPELIISAPLAAGAPRSPATGTTTLDSGAAVWVVGGDHDGATGRIARVLQSTQVMPSGIRVHAARVALDIGGEITLPLANLQRVG